jgi:two-component system cell cycle response regulator
LELLRRLWVAAGNTAVAVVVSRVLWGLGFLIVAGHGAYTTFGIGRGRWDWVVSPWTPCVVFALCAAVSVARGLWDRRDRPAWFVLAIGLACYSLCQALVSLDTPSAISKDFPAPPDVVAWGLHVSGLVAIGLLVRTQRRRSRADLWLDGVIGGLAAASIGVVVIFDLVIDPLASLAGSPGNVVYVLGDLLVLGFGLGSFAVLGWRPSRALVAVIIGFAALAVDDTMFMSAMVKGTFVPAGPLDSYWQLAVLLIAAAAAWSPPARQLDQPVKPTGVVAFPLVFALAAVVLAGYQALTANSNLLAVALTTLTLLAVVVRFALTFRAHLTMIEVSERNAITDALTGLGNRRKLLRDAEIVFANASRERPVLFAIFDLDGLKIYNDTYGHPAGDALLARLGAKLANAIGPAGQAYRLGGDEFCILLSGDPPQRAQGLAAATAALTDQGESFTIGSCYGSVLVPAEAQNTTEAMRCADRRLYTAKAGRSSAPASQAREALRQILLESEPALDDHHDVVSRLAHAVACRLGINGEELVTTMHAAELRDIGKIAIPDAILHKPGPLTDDEWQFMRRHATIGERFLRSIPALKDAARIVRASHERYDGGGYPDGLQAQQIPLGARIIFACDAYHAMTTDHPHRTGMSHDDALAELRRHSGTQFDPCVIEALVAVLTTFDPHLRLQ